MSGEGKSAGGKEGTYSSSSYSRPPSPPSHSPPPSSSSSSSSSSRIQVMTGTGNERHGSISGFPREVEQCVLDIASWYTRAAAKRGGDVQECYGEGGPDLSGVGEAGWKTIADVYGPKFGYPESLQMLLGKCDGQLYLYEFQLLSPANIVAKAERFGLQRKAWFPVAQDIDETLLIINLESGAVFSCDAPDDGNELGPPEELARSFGSYLEGLRDKLLAHKLEFIMDSGLVEVVGAISPARSGAGGKK